MKLRDALLWPFSLPYEIVVRLRSEAYNHGLLPQRRLGATVISVGNLTVGGTGKTPMVLWIAERLLAEGKDVGILTRGYRAKPRSVTQPSSASSDSTSDEVQLMRARLGGSVAFGVGANRFARGSELATRGIKYFVLDDGFQHRQLARDVDIVLIDATNPFGGGHLLPAGRQREPRSALARANILVITRGDHSPAIEAAVRHDSNAPVFYAKPQLESIHLAEDNSAADVAALRKKRFFAFCGIGNPPAFLADLREWGFEVAGHKFFPDHHLYTQRDALLIESEARRTAAETLICTEKDFFNLRGSRGDVRWEDLPVFYCRISMRIDRPEQFWSAILACLQSSARM
jgi:tetraacyldisaccharide 4'-kinase